MTPQQQYAQICQAMGLPSSTAPDALRSALDAFLADMDPSTDPTLSDSERRAIRDAGCTVSQFLGAKAAMRGGKRAPSYARPNAKLVSTVLEIEKKQPKIVVFARKGR